MYCAMRFFVAGVVMFPSSIGYFGNLDLAIRSSYIGLSVMLGYVGQTIGMQLGSSADKCAFITSLNVVWVAFVVGIQTGAWKVETWLAIVFAILGVAFLELSGSTESKWCDLWLVCQPIGFGTGYLLLEDVIKDYPNDAGAITSFKVLAITFCSVVWAFIFDGNTIEDVGVVLQSQVAVAGILYTGLITTAIAIWVQSVAFKKVSAKDVSMILTTEPIWAALFSMCKFSFKLNGVIDCISMLTS